MERRFELRAAGVSAAPIEVVWHTLASHEHWPEWSPFDEVSIERAGSPSRDGVGAVRMTRLGRKKAREEVVRFDAPHTYGYRLLSGLPVSDYEALVLLTEVPGGTSIAWEAEFRERYPLTGPVVASRLEAFLQEMVASLAAAAAVPFAR